MLLFSWVFGYVVLVFEFSSLFLSTSIALALIGLVFYDRCDRFPLPDLSQIFRQHRFPNDKLSNGHYYYALVHLLSTYCRPIYGRRAPCLSRFMEFQNFHNIKSFITVFAPFLMHIIALEHLFFL